MQLDALFHWLRQFPSIAVAFSGGVDSAVLLAAAKQAVGAENVVALVAVSPALPKTERENAEQLAQNLEVTCQLVPTDQLEDPDFQRNDRLRCCYCKRRLFQKLLEVSQELGSAVLLEGSNADDALAYRPGAKAIAELGIPSPLLQFGLSKAEIRALAAEWGLSAAGKPSVPCLATRLEYGLPVTGEILAKVETAEQIVREVLEVTTQSFRARVHSNGLLRLELDEELQCRLKAGETELAGGTDSTGGAKWAELDQRLRALGFRQVTLDLSGFRSGSWDV